MLRTGYLRLALAILVFFALAGCSLGTASTPVSTTTPTASSIAGLASPTTSVRTNTCFVHPEGPKVPSIYAGNATPSAGPMTAPALSGTPVISADGLGYVDIKVGSGAAAQVGSQITANYTGWLASNCQKFDSSFDAHGGQAPGPFTAQLTADQLIKGWVEGIAGMKAGGLRRLYIPAALGYGNQAAGTIPANSDLIFDVQLLAVH